MTVETIPPRRDGRKEERRRERWLTKLKEPEQAHASCQELQAQLVVKNQEIQMLQAELEMLNEEPSNQSC